MGIDRGLSDFNCTRELRQTFSLTLFQPEAAVTNEIASLVGRAGSLESAAVAARLSGDESAADGCFHEAFGFALEAAHLAAEGALAAERLGVLRLAVRLALECGEVTEARRVM